jgi:hypothetical protein
MTHKGYNPTVGLGSVNCRCDIVWKPVGDARADREYKCIVVSSTLIAMITNRVHCKTCLHGNYVFEPVPGEVITCTQCDHEVTV